MKIQGARQGSLSGSLESLGRSCDPGTGAGPTRRGTLGNRDFPPPTAPPNNYLSHAPPPPSQQTNKQNTTNDWKCAGKLTKGGEPDLNTVGKMVLLDWQRGRLPFFTLPPDHVDLEEDEAGAEAGHEPAEEPASEDDEQPLVVGGVTVSAAPRSAAGAAPSTDGTVPASRKGLRRRDLVPRRAPQSNPIQSNPDPDPARRKYSQEDDAATIPDGDPEKAAAAARALAAAAAEEIAGQRSNRIPVQRGFFNPEDAGDASDGETASGSEASDIAAPSDSDAEADDAASPAGDETKDDSDDDDDDDDGYGEDGLSWEAVMESIAVSAGE